MPRYIVKDTHIKHGVGKVVTEYAPGDEIELTEEQARALGPNVVPVAETKKDLDKGKGR